MSFRRVRESSLLGDSVARREGVGGVRELKSDEYDSVEFVGEVEGRGEERAEGIKGALVIAGVDGTEGAGRS